MTKQHFFTKRVVSLWGAKLPRPHHGLYPWTPLAVQPQTYILALPLQMTFLRQCPKDSLLRHQTQPRLMLGKDWLNDNKNGSFLLTYVSSRRYVFDSRLGHGCIKTVGMWFTLAPLWSSSIINRRWSSVTGLALHWPCVTDFSGLTTYGIKAYARQISILPVLQCNMEPLTLCLCLITLRLSTDYPPPSVSRRSSAVQRWARQHKTQVKSEHRRSFRPLQSSVMMLPTLRTEKIQ